MGRGHVFCTASVCIRPVLEHYHSMGIPIKVLGGQRIMSHELHRHWYLTVLLLGR
jgi:hypothetical protein